MSRRALRLSSQLTCSARAYHSGKPGPKVCATADEAVRAVKSGDRVFVHGVAATPIPLLTALAKRHDELRQVEFCHLHLDRPNPCATEEYAKSFVTNNFFIGANQRKLVDRGFSSYIPTFLSEIPSLMRRGLVTPDVAFLNVSPPDKHGMCSLGVEVATALPATQTAKILIAQINPSMPRTHGYSFVHYSNLDYVFHVDEPLPCHVSSEPSEVEAKIGKIIAGLVSDGATLQMGIGAIPDAVLASLSNHKDLGIHTEMFAERAIDLIQSGVVTNLHKTFMPSKTVTSFVMGSQRLYDFVDDNPGISFWDASVANNPRIIGSNPKVTAINSAVEVDITGQVCADSIGTKMISGVGGQVDFERGAAISQGGVPIICLPSTAKNGESKIVLTLKEGAGVITTRNHTHYVVTEYGAAYLFGKNMVERAAALIEIAHPDHREELERGAFERFKVKTWRH
ncbi:acetyl-CoA hydrolase/transferase family protein [Polychytrium aggregatum]|uniref:acetyl-CoA hydrolase/transferase family protein n=1 Tax=Polychytrium aggregatum TaxID=110093 RepID=UPI0022FEA9F6|nr:acetyl-CoA hydrolase/transferase family protein [Polychytrium aggregatum]KAI9197071.1 acetyl-CoA hydrolase/transferase family protein [Polychytrium aggregatum]